MKHAANPAFAFAALSKAAGIDVDVASTVGHARICAGDVVTGAVGDVDAFLIGLWAHLARKDIWVVDFRLRGLAWEARSRLGVWTRVSHLLDAAEIAEFDVEELLCPA